MCLLLKRNCTCHLSGASFGHLQYSPRQPLSVSRHGIDSQDLRLRPAHQFATYKMDCTSTYSRRRAALRPHHMEDRL
jgi:hypothetical protein